MIQTAEQLDDALSAPPVRLVEMMRRIDGDLVILGVGGKMGPTLARMARRAADAAGKPRRIIGAARFSEAGLERQLQQCGVETIRCDLLDLDSLRRLPDAPNIVYLVGMKFGTTGREAQTWAINTAVPTLVSQRYRGVRMVALSSGNVYGLSSIARGGAKEADGLEPVGEYAMSAVGRERIFQHYAEAHSTPTAIIRLFYAFELRYGVPVDIAQKIVRGEAIDLAMGHASVIWQGDANAQALLALEHVATPARPINVSGPRIVRIRDVAQRLAARLGREPRFTGVEADSAIVCDTSLSQQLFGPPEVELDQALDWVADWVQRGGASLGKPTHFEDRRGRF